MKIDNKDLKNLYKQSISFNKVQDECPATKELFDLIENNISTKKRKKIISHISKCKCCAGEIKFVINTLKFENKINQAINKIINPYILHKKFPKLPFLYLVEKRILIITIIVAISIITCSFYFFFMPKESPNFRGNELYQIKLFAPINETFVKKKIEFKWSNISDCEYFILDIFRDDFSLLWKSKRIYSNIFQIPLNFKEKFVKNKRYYWIITGHFKNGFKIESEVGCFKLIN